MILLPVNLMGVTAAASSTGCVRLLHFMGACCQGPANLRVRVCASLVLADTPGLGTACAKYAVSTVNPKPETHPSSSCIMLHNHFVL
jgi:hypothetical protein